MQIPGVDLNEIYDGWTLSQNWEYYTVNVKLLGTMTHEQFVAERPHAAEAIEKASRFMDAMAKLAEKEQ